VPALAGRRVSVLIWTTTPWTIPSNLAVAFHPEFDYAAYDVDGRAVIVAEALADEVAAAGREFGAPIARMKGAALEGLRFRHPLYARDSLGVLADYVTLDAGTGAVHTAPGHGADDFTPACKYGLEIYAPIGPGGHFLETVELVRRASGSSTPTRVVELLHERARLWHRESFSHHQYPHCWRCHNPVIFLATPQWFIRMDGERCGVTGDGADAARKRRCIARSTTTSDGFPPGATIGFATWWPTAPTGASRASAHGACRSRRSTARPAARLSQPAIVEQAARCFEAHGADAWYERPDRGVPPGGSQPVRRAAARVRARAEHPRRLVRLRVEPRGGAVRTPRS
jgi:isoleucyl-tRNA synthetase